MRAAVVTKPGVLEVLDVAEPEVASDGVLLQVAAAGICGSDLHVLRGEYVPGLPVTPGHEFSGTVVSVGDSVTDFKPGDRVTADPNIYCGHCAQCRRGHDNLCLRALAVGLSLPGALAERVAVPASNCVLVPEGFLLEAAALSEPLSCVVHAFDIMAAEIGQSVAVIGAGPIGLMIISLVKELAAQVTAIDLNEERLEAARAAGADVTATAITGLGGSHGFDIVIDCTGSVAAIESGLERLALGGTYLQFGVPEPDALVRFRPERLLMAEQTFVGAKAVKHSFERAAALLFHGAISPDLLITDRYGLEDTRAALEKFASGQSRKVFVLPGA